MNDSAIILLADDDPGICTVVSQALQRKGYRVKATHRGEELRRWVAEGAGDVAITDVLMPGMNGLELLPEIHTLRPDLPVIVISAQNTLMTAVKASERGAFEYLPKPFDLGDLTHAVQKALELRHTGAAPKEPLAETPLIGSGPAMQALYRTLARMMGNDLTVLITGESGTGKELAAHALHQLGKRKHKPFIAINMAAIPKELVESELFGHEKGAFTGAISRKAGLFAQASGGTLFLDEIGDMPMEAQTKLLRVLQQGEYTTVGGTTPLKADARIICATHRDLHARVQSGEFREDLYYRLNVVPVTIPPLRERREDLPVLAAHFLKKAEARGMKAKTLSPEALSTLQHYDWPGNVRELENLLYRVTALYADPIISGQTIMQELGKTKSTPTPYAEGSLCDTIRQHLAAYFSAHTHGLPAPGLYDRIVHAVEKPLLEITMDAVGGNQIRAAELLGINRNTLRKKLRELNIGTARHARAQKESRRA